MSNFAAWTCLLFAGLFEVCWAVGLKYSAGFTRLGPSVFTVVTLAFSMVLLAQATHRLPLGTAYGVWVGIGAMGTALLGIVLFKEPATAARIFFLTLLFVSIVGLKLTSGKGTL